MNLIHNCGGKLQRWVLEESNFFKTFYLCTNCNIITNLETKDNIDSV